MPVVESEDHDQACKFINTGLACTVMGLMCDWRKYKKNVLETIFLPSEKQVSNKIFLKYSF